MCILHRKQQRFFYSSVFSLKFSKELFFQLKLFIIWKLIELSSISIRTLPPLMSYVNVFLENTLFIIGPLCIPTQVK